MLTGRLIRAVEAVLNEYSKFEILAKLQQAIEALTLRGNPNGSYRRRAQELRGWANMVLSQTSLDKQPNDMKSFLKESNYSTALPENIARVVLTGLPDDETFAVSSSEIGLYFKLANSLVHELRILVSVCEKLGIERIDIPENEVSLDVIIPRSVFENKTDSFIDLLSRFSRTFSYFNELTTGSKSAPSLTYCSTSDPVTGFAVACATAWAFLKFYKLLLEVAEKQLSLIKTFKELRGVAPDQTLGMDERISEIVEKALTKTVEHTVKSAPSTVPEERVREISLAITKDSRVILQSIAKGVRVGITLESLDMIPGIADKLPNLTAEEISELLQQQKELEVRVESSFSTLDTPMPILISRDDQNSKK